MNTACQQCRRSKAKCDLKTPQCGSCARRNIRCLSSDLESSRAASSLPPGYLEGLEAELAALEHRAKSHGGGRADQNDGGGMPSPSTLDVTLHHQDTTESFDWAAIGEGDSARLHPILSYSLGDMFWAAVAVDNKSPYHSAQPNSLIPRTRHRRPPGSAFQDQNPSLAKTYLDAFLTTVQPCLPILSPAETAVAESPAAQMSMALGAMHRPGGDPVSQYHAVHLLEGALDAIGNVQTDLRTLRLFVLVTLFSLFHCAAGSTWHLHGLTLQVAVALGLHHRPVRRAQHMQTPEDLEKESLFWVAYVLDRLVSISLGRPLGIDDADISVETPASNRDTELLAMLVSIARRASLVYTAKSDRSPQSDMAVLPDTIPNHASPLFQTLAFQLAIWTTRNIHSVQRQAIGGLHDCLATCGTLLVHFQGGMVNHVPMPWTSAYAILHIAVTARAASALCLLRQDVNQDNHGESLGSIEATEALDSVPAQLASLSRTFHGLQELCLLYDQIRTTQATSTTRVNWDAMGNHDTLEAIRFLGRLRPRPPAGRRLTQT